KSRAFALKSLSLFIFSAMAFQLSIGYSVRQFSKPRFMTKRSAAPWGNCLRKPEGSKKRPLASMATSYSPRKLVIIDLSRVLPFQTQNNTNSHNFTQCGSHIFFHNNIYG